MPIPDRDQEDEMHPTPAATRERRSVTPMTSDGRYRHSNQRFLAELPGIGVGKIPVCEQFDTFGAPSRLDGRTEF